MKHLVMKHLVMKRWIPVCILIVAAGAATPQLVSLTGGGGAVVHAAVKGPSLADFMFTVHDPQGLLGQIRTAVQKDGPADDKAWKSVKGRAAVIVALSEALIEKAPCPKGDKASWKEKVAAYLTSTRELAKATAAKDLDAARGQVQKLSKGCQACHKAHK